MTEKDITLEELEETANQTNAQIDLLEWKVGSDKVLPDAIPSQEVCVMNGQEVCVMNGQEICVMNLLRSVSEVRSDYQQLRQELVEVQELQRELSSRLRAQLRMVHGKFARLRQKIAAVPPH